MSQFSKSLAYLVKYNAGFFKSEKQANYLLNATGGCVVVSNAFSLGNDYNNKRVGDDARTVYTLDNKGVVTVIKHNAKGVVTVFNRNCKKSLAANKERLQEGNARLERGKLYDSHYKELLELEAFEEALREHIIAILLSYDGDGYYTRVKKYRNDLKAGIEAMRETLEVLSY